MHNNTDIITLLYDFIDLLNKESQNGAIVVVEGKRDANALNKAGFNGNISIFNNYRGINDFVDICDFGKKIILLFDADYKGKELSKKIHSLLSLRGKNPTFYYRMKLSQLSRGRVKQIEEIDGIMDSYFMSVKNYL